MDCSSSEYIKFYGNIRENKKIKPIKHFFLDLFYIMRHTHTRLGIFSITKKIILLMMSAYLILGGLFYQYTQKVSFPSLLSHQEQQMDSIALFTTAEISHIPELNSDRLNYVKRKILENSHIFNIFISSYSIGVGQNLQIETDMHLHYLKKQPLLAKKYPFEDGYFIIYFKADQFVEEVQGIVNTAYLTFIFMFLTLIVIAIVLKLTLLPFTQLSSLMTNIAYNSPVSYSLPKVSSKDERYDLISAFVALSYKQQ